MALAWKLHHFKHQIVYLLGSGFHHVRLQHLRGGDHDDKDVSDGFGHSSLPSCTSL